ncbi:hypothetical protein [Nostoc sp.]|uniref:hypothetical protein n=1 Tax=Nostoc sp. TaxID=1180 RepID=UPI002FF4B91D
MRLPNTVVETVASLPPSRIVSKAVRPTVFGNWGVNDELHTQKVVCWTFQAHQP